VEKLDREKGGKEGHRILLDGGVQTENLKEDLCFAPKGGSSKDKGYSFLGVFTHKRESTLGKKNFPYRKKKKTSTRQIKRRGKNRLGGKTKKRG